MRKKTIQEQFNFDENPAAAGLMYFIRYSSERIDSHRKQVVNALESIGIEFKYANGCEIEVHGPNRILTKSFRRRLDALLEELSVLNEASTYYDYGLESIKDLTKFRDAVILTYFNLLSGHKKEQAYEYISKDIPRQTQELRIADENKCLYTKERKALDEIERFCRTQEQLLYSLLKKEKIA